MSVSMRPHFGTDGIRGNADQELTDNFVYALGMAIGAAINKENSEIVIGRDTRSTGLRIEKALAAGLSKSGLKVINIGILPTPAISLYAEKRNVFACAITASHNPAQDNGIKVFAQGGTKTDETFETEIETHIDAFLDHAFKETDISIKDESDVAFNLYINWLEQLFTELNLENITVALDCANGAAYKTAPTIFEKFGANTFAINTENDGMNINKECGATNLKSLENFIQNNNVDIAFAFDGDADRIIVLDENAQIYDGDYILALLASNSNLDPKTIVTTSMSNGALKDYLLKIETDFIETNVGDKNVAIAMSESKAKIGGEQSGHIIHKDYAHFGDGVLIALLISQIFADKRKQSPNIKASEILNLFTPMVQLHEKVIVANKTKAVSSDKIEQSIEEHLELLGQNARIVIRPSGTEDIVRIMVEANEKDLASKSMNELIEVVKESCKG